MGDSGNFAGAGGAAGIEALNLKRLQIILQQRSRFTLLSVRSNSRHLYRREECVWSSLELEGAELIELAAVEKGYFERSVI